MTFDALQKIADAVLFEGYILYPYRPSAIKNRQRWNFGTLYPDDFAQRQKNGESSSFHTEILVELSPASTLDLRIRFLELIPPDAGASQEWDRGVVRNWTLSGLTLSGISRGLATDLTPQTLALEAPEISFPAPQAPPEYSLCARLELSAQTISPGVYRLSATVSNRTRISQPDIATRLNAQRASFTSAHLLLRVENGAFVSLLDPPPPLAAATAACSNRGVFPVLAGPPGTRTSVLCSPIILYDYPQIAPESAGDFFDGTEMDEMLALRIMTLSDDEKREMRAGDPYARRILERTESLPQEHLLKVHGAIRGMRPLPEESPSVEAGIQPWNPFEEKPPVESVTVFGYELRKGGRVRLWPQKRADIIDMALAGRTAVVEAIEQDLEDNLQLAVVLDDDPGKDLGMLRQPGHRFFFTPDEVEPLSIEQTKDPS